MKIKRVRDVFDETTSYQIELGNQEMLDLAEDLYQLETRGATYSRLPALYRVWLKLQLAKERGAI